MVRLPLPKNFPKDFKTIDNRLSEIIEHLSEFRDKHPKFMKGFFDSYEGMYLEMLSLKGEEKNIFAVGIYISWCQMMAIMKEKE